MGGRIFLASVGDTQLAVWHHAGGGTQSKLDELRNAGEAARLLWSTAGSLRDLRALDEELAEHRIAEGLYAMSASQVDVFLDVLKQRAQRNAQQRGRQLIRGQVLARRAAEEVREARRLQRQHEERRALRENADIDEVLKMMHPDYGRPRYADVISIIEDIRARGTTRPIGTLRRAATYPDAADSKSIEEVAEALKRVGLEHLVDKLEEDAPRDQTLPGGEKQRVVQSCLSTVEFLLYAARGYNPAAKRLDIATEAGIDHRRAPLPVSPQNITLPLLIGPTSLLLLGSSAVA